MATKPSINRVLSLRGISISPSVGDRDDSNRAEFDPLISQCRSLAVKLIEQHASPSTIFAELRLPKSLSLSQGSVRFRIDPEVSLPIVPSNYGFKGGLARNALEHALAPLLKEQFDIIPPRDIDLVRRAGTSRADDEVLLKELNPLDYERGAAVEEIKDLNRYFSSRDLSINEVVIFDMHGYASPLAILDSLGRTLRPTRYTGGSLHSKRSLSAMTVAKCLRLAAEHNSINPKISWCLVGVPDQQEVTSFALAVQLKKALERGIPIAQTFLQYCMATGVRFVDESKGSIKTVNEFLEELLEDLPDKGAFFSEAEIKALMIG